MKNPNPMFTELEPNTNLIFFKYSDPDQNRNLIIKEPRPNTNPKFWFFSISNCYSADSMHCHQ